ncbi:MAG: prepilin-type N-terminal cleavage/methylation domain-containing protein [Smithellaceae bacterium]|nr:prepilin-type N-terminal cleavage/methylation domain-containing protein [Smithellaceae bacterium]
MAESMKTMKRFEYNKGFTLIEVLIAIVILTIGLLALVSVTVMVIKGNSLNRGITTATTLANQQLETLKNTSYSGIDSSSACPSTWSTVTGFSGYEQKCGVSTSGYQKTIVMEVRWFWLGTEKKVILNTIISK